MLKDIMVTDAIVMADGAQLVTSGADGVCRLWDISDRSRPLLKSCTRGMSFYAEGAVLSTATKITPINQDILQLRGATLEDEPQQVRIHSFGQPLNRLHENFPPYVVRQAQQAARLAEKKADKQQQPEEQEINQRPRLVHTDKIKFDQKHRPEKLTRTTSAPTTPRTSVSLTRNAQHSQDDSDIMPVNRGNIGFFPPVPDDSGLPPLVNASGLEIFLEDEEENSELSASLFLAPNSK